MWSQLQLSAVLILAVVLAGCATDPQYQAAVRSLDEGAQVSGSMNSYPLVVKLQRVDGRRLGYWQEQSVKPVLIEPGTRLLTVHGEYVGLPLSGQGDAELKAILQAGHAYQLQVERNGRLLTFWVEDVATHEAVSDRQTTKASVYIPFGP